MTNMTGDGALPPKSSTVDKLVTLAQDVEKVIAGEKRAARRNGRHADVGEMMHLQGHQFIIERVYQQALGDMTDEDARNEAFVSLDVYKQFILSMHPGMPWSPNMKVWVHEFRPIGG